MKKYTVRVVEELVPIAHEVITMAGKNNNNSAAVLALQGDLGTGKTTFMQILAKELGVIEQITSPTFVVMKKYDATHAVFKELIHIDVYRIDDIDEMRPLRFAAELSKKDTIIGIEWAEKIESLLPRYAIHITFAIKDAHRLITVSTDNEEKI